MVVIEPGIGVEIALARIVGSMVDARLVGITATRVVGAIVGIMVDARRVGAIVGIMVDARRVGIIVGTIVDARKVGIADARAGNGVDVWGLRVAAIEPGLGGTELEKFGGYVVGMVGRFVGYIGYGVALAYGTVVTDVMGVGVATIEGRRTGSGIICSRVMPSSSLNFMTIS